MNLFKFNREKLQNLCDECYSLMKKYSKSRNEWEFASKLDIKEVDEKVLKCFKQKPEIAQMECEIGIPLILFCVECGLVNSVKWYVNRGKNVNIKDDEADNIAMYAYKFDVSELIAFCSTNKELADYQNKNGVSLSYLLERDRKREEIKAQTLKGKTDSKLHLCVSK